MRQLIVLGFAIVFKDDGFRIIRKSIGFSIGFAIVFKDDGFRIIRKNIGFSIGFSIVLPMDFVSYEKLLVVLLVFQ